MAAKRERAAHRARHEQPKEGGVGKGTKTDRKGEKTAKAGEEEEAQKDEAWIAAEPKRGECAAAADLRERGWKYKYSEHLTAPF